MRAGTSEPNVGDWPWQILGTIRVVATVWEGSFIKTQKLLTKVSGLVALGCHNCAMITNAESSRPNGAPMGCLVSTFNIRINL